MVGCQIYSFFWDPECKIWPNIQDTHEGTILFDNHHILKGPMIGAVIHSVYIMGTNLASSRQAWNPR